MTRDASDDYLPFFPWEVERWFASDTFLRAPLDVQGAYLNLCFAAWRRQPTLTLPDDDSILQKLSGARSPEEWARLKEATLAAPWERHGNDRGEWWHPVVAQVFADAWERHRRTVQAGKIGGKASARVRRERSKLSKRKGHGTSVEAPLNDRSSEPQATITITTRTADGPSPSVGSSPEPSPKKERDARPAEPTGPVGQEELKLEGSPRRMKAADAISYVFAHWQTVMEHPTARLTPERERLIRARLKDGYSVRKLCRAIDGCRLSPHHMGENDRITVYDDLTLIMRSGSKVEGFISQAERAELAAGQTAPKPPEPPWVRAGMTRDVWEEKRRKALAITNSRKERERAGA